MVPTLRNLEFWIITHPKFTQLTNRNLSTINMPYLVPQEDSKLLRSLQTGYNHCLTIIFFNIGEYVDAKANCSSLRKRCVWGQLPVRTGLYSGEIQSQPFLKSNELSPLAVGTFRCNEPIGTLNLQLLAIVACESYMLTYKLLYKMKPKLFTEVKDTLKYITYIHYI
jgi:hypothetical protein